MNNKKMLGDKEVIEWDFSKQIVWQQMSPEEFERFMVDKVILYNGKYYTSDKLPEVKQ